MQKNLIIVTNVNEVYVKIDCSEEVAFSLSNLFSFEAPDYKYHPKYKAGIWDGIIRLFNPSIRGRLLYKGLLYKLHEYAEENNLEVELDFEESLNDEVYEPIVVSNKSGQEIEMRHYQIDAVKYAIENKRGVLISPTASGKSLIIYNIIRHHLKYNRKILIVVPKKDLVNQLYSDFEEYSQLNGFETNKYVQKVYGGLSKDITHNIVISTWQSIFKLSSKWYSGFDVVIGDEAHTMQANSLKTMMESMVNTKFRFGLTGTLKNTKAQEFTISGLLGQSYIVAETKELIEVNALVDLNLICVVINHPPTDRPKLIKCSWGEEIGYLCKNDNRNIFLAQLALSRSENTLVLFKFIEHGKKITELIKEKVEEMGKQVFYIDGTIKDRTPAKIACETHNNVIIVASYDTMSTGVNIPSISNIIFASSTKSEITVMQSIGRGLRLNGDKQVCNVFDITDDLSSKNWTNYVLRHATQRYQFYHQRGLGMKLLKVDL